MEHPFFPTSTTRAEALQWLSISEKLLYSRDLFGSKTLATRARDADPTLTHADQILAVVDTLLTGDIRLGNNSHDWYAILRLSPSQGRDGNLIAASYRKLASWLNPQVNKYPYADQAFRLLVDAWTVLSNPSSKDAYDREIGVFVPMQPDPFVISQNQFQGMGQNQNFMFFGGSSGMNFPVVGSNVDGSSGMNFPVVGSNVGVHRVDPGGLSTQATQSFMGVPRVDPVGPSSSQATQSFMGVQRVNPVGPSSTQATPSFMGVKRIDPVGSSTQATQSFMGGQRVEPVGSSTQETQSFMGVQRVDPAGPSTQATQSFIGVGSGSTSRFGLNINMGQETVYRQANHGYSSNFPGNVRDVDEELRNNNGFININANANDAASSDNVDMNVTYGANMADTNRDLGNTNININSNGSNVHVAESNENVDMNDTVSEFEDFAPAMNTEENTDNFDATTEKVDNEDKSSFWTACPYCYCMYEYPETYIDCTLRCRNCKNAFQGVVIPSPPPTLDDQESYFCCWGFLPLGFSMEVFERNKANIPSWTPSIPVTRTKSAVSKTKNTGPWVYLDDDDDQASVDISDASVSSDDDWHRAKEKKTNKSTKIGRRNKLNNAARPNTRSGVKAKADKCKVQDELVVEVEAEPGNNNDSSKKRSGSSGNKKGVSITPRKQPPRVAKNCGKLNLNVELSNEAEDSGSGATQENRKSPDQGEDDNIEGTGFFEGLDEFLSSLPILNPGGDDKVAKGG